MHEPITKNKSYKGVARGRLIDLEDGATIPEGTHVNIIPDEPLIAEVSTSLKEWLRDARRVRKQLPTTGDSVEILRELREGRAE